MAEIDQDPEIAALGAPRVPGTLDYIGLAAGLIPFVISFRSSQSQSFTTTVTDADGNTKTTSSGSTTFSDPIALIGGGVAVIIAIVLFTQISKVDKAKRALRIGLALGILALGVLQLVVRSGILS